MENSSPPRVGPVLAAFGPPIWAYKPVKILGVQIAAAVVATISGLVFLLLPVTVAFVVGIELGESRATPTVAPSDGTQTTEVPLRLRTAAPQ